MKLIIFSSSDRSVSEAKEVTEMFDLGLKFFHLRKASFQQNELCAYLDVIPNKYHKRIVLHSNHHLKKAYKLGGLHLSRTHRKKKYKSGFKFLMFKMMNSGLYLTRTYSKLSTLSDDKRAYKYVFLSPVYNSISKIGHSGNFGNRSIEKYVKIAKSPVVALGGIEISKFKECKELGFDGVALLGSIWNSEEETPLEAFKSAKKALENL
jgi:thiamine-phosphate pyrophosphorylase